MTEFATPNNDRYFEDYQPGSKFTFGPIKVDEEEILEFATKYDPQSIHVDRDAAARGPFGGLIASGWHTAAMMMRLLADNYLSANASMASPGVDELRWVAPVRPGDDLRLVATVADSRRSKSKPDRGIVHTDIELINQDDQVVLTMKAMNFIGTRDAVPE